MKGRHWVMLNGLPRYLARFGSELAYAKTFIVPATRGMPVYRAVIRGTEHPHDFDDIDALKAYVETVIALSSLEVPTT